MGKKIKVYLQYPWKASECSYYKYLLTNTPKGIEYITSKEKGGVIENKWKMMFYRKMKHAGRRIFRFLNISIPNTKAINNSKKLDLIHGAHCLIKNKKPWVADFEYVGQLWSSIMPENPTKKDKRKIRGLLNSKYCKKILPWTKWAKNTIIDEFPEIKDKLEVVYPGLKAPKFKKKKHKGTNLLFVSRFFYSKGAYHALEVMDRLTKKYEDVKATLISQVPKKVKKEYSKNDKIKIYDLIPQEKLFQEIYPSADIFIYPGYIDSFGFPLTEAMSYQLPIIAADTNSRKEIVQNKKTGYVVNCPNLKTFSRDKIGEKENKVIEKMVNKASKLIENRNEREKMGKAGRKEITEGKFSIKNRNKKLKKIYREAVR